jgi:hypothetical protein
MQFHVNTPESRAAFAGSITIYRPLDIKFWYEIYLTEKSLQHCRFAMTEHCFIGFAISQ